MPPDAEPQSDQTVTALRNPPLPIVRMEYANPSALHSLVDYTDLQEEAEKALHMRDVHAHAPHLHRS